MYLSYYASRQLGFTLIELILVIGILSILAVVSLPKFFEPSPFMDRAKYDEIKSSLRYAQKLANATNCQTQFQSVENGRQVQIMMQQACNQGDFTRAVHNPGTLESHFSISLEDTTLTITPDGPITFYPEGHISSADQSVPFIRIGNQTLTISPQTGFIHAQ